jgi:hypothetical protein
VGERLSAPGGSPAAPLDIALGGPRPPTPSSPSLWVPSTDDPGHSRGQEGGGSTGLFAAASFGQSHFGAPLDRRLFSAEDADSPWTFSVPRRAFTEPRRPLTLPWSLTGTPESSSVSPDVLSLFGVDPFGLTPGARTLRLSLLFTNPLGLANGD